MLTGTLISYNGKVKLIRANNGVHYSFETKQLEAPGTWRPAMKEAVIINLQDGKQPVVVRSVQRLPPGHLKATYAERMVPARYVGWGVAVSRLVPGIEVSIQLRTQNKIRPGSIVMVRYDLKDNTLATATELVVAGGSSEYQQALAAALLADEAAVQMGKEELLRLLGEVTEVVTDEQYQHLKDLLQLWDAYTYEPMPLRFSPEDDAARKLAAEGYAYCLTKEVLLQIVQQSDGLILMRDAVRRLPVEALRELIMERLNVLTAETPLEDYQLMSQWLKAVPELIKSEPLLQPPALSQLPLPGSARICWWEEGLVSMPAQRLLTAEMNHRVQQVQGNAKKVQTLRRLLEACRRHNCLERTSRQLLAGTSVAERLATLKVLMPLVDGATGAKWAEEFLVEQVANEELYAAWGRNELPWLPAEVVANQLLSDVSLVSIPVALPRLAQLPNAVQALSLAGGQEPWQDQRAIAIKAVLQALHKVAKPPASPVFILSLAKPTSGFTVVWAKEALLALQKSVMNLPGATWVSWWLEGLMPEPTADMLLAHCFGEEGSYQEAGWRRLSESGAKELEKPLVAWLQQNQSVAWLDRAQQSWVGNPQLIHLGQQVSVAIGNSWSAAARVELWLRGYNEQPGPTKPQTLLAHHGSGKMAPGFSSLPALLDHYLAEHCAVASPALVAGPEATDSSSEPLLDSALDTEVEAQWLELAERAIRVRFADILRYLPQASRHLFSVAAEQLCAKRIFGNLPISERVLKLSSFAQSVIERWSREPDLILPWLVSIVQQCQIAKSVLAHSSYEVRSASTQLLRSVAWRVVPQLDVHQQLEWWISGLIDARPAATQSELVEFAVQSMPAAAAQRVADTYAVPEEVVRAWRLLGNLQPDLFDQQFPAVRSLLAEAAYYPDQLQAVGPYLDAELSAAQRDSLWLFGYPSEPPTDGGHWTVAERMQGVVRLDELKLDLTTAPWLAPTGEELEEWLTEQYWEEEEQALAGDTFKLVEDYYDLAVVELPEWEELEAALLLRCAGVVKVRLWMTLSSESQQRTFNYYTFRRGYSRLRAAEQREFLRLGQQYLRTAEKTEQEFKSAPHLRRRRLLRQKDGVSVYRVSLAHCYCPQAGYLEVELADKMHTLPFAYPEAQEDWNSRFVREPWSGCPVLAYVDDRTRELLKIQGLEAALIQYPTDQEPRARYSFQRERKVRGTTDNPVGYWQDESLHDELSNYLLELTEDTPLEAVVLTEKLAERSRLSEPFRPAPKAERPEPEELGSGGDEEDELVLGQAMLPRQMVLSPIVVHDEVVFVWAPQFANSNRATYVFRAPLLHQEQAMERLTDLLQDISGIRSALLAPGPASHRLRRHLGYVRTIRGQRGKAQAFEGWRKRLDAAIEEGPGRQHPYDPDSTFNPEELLKLPTLIPLAVALPDFPEAEPTSTMPDVAQPYESLRLITAQRMLRQLQHFNTLFLAGYPA